MFPRTRGAPATREKTWSASRRSVAESAVAGISDPPSAPGRRSSSPRCSDSGRSVAPERRVAGPILKMLLTRWHFLQSGYRT